MSHSAWPTATEVRAIVAASNFSLGAAVTDAIIDNYVSAAAEQLQIDCRGTQFIAGSAGEIRYFDGSGTGMMAIDEYVTITDVSILAVPQSGTIPMVAFVEVNRVGFPKSQIQIYQGPPVPAYGYYTRYPEGRQNIKVTGTWGVASTIPELAWAAVRDRAASKVVGAARMDESGYALDGIKDDDVTLSYNSAGVDQATGWGDTWKSAVRAYKRSTKNYFRRSDAGYV